MAIFSKNDSTSKLEIELSRLEKRKSTLVGKLENARKAETATREAQRNHLLSDDENPATAAKIAADVASASADVAAIEDAIQTVDDLIAEGRTAIVAAKESAARAKRAAEIETRIKKLEPLCAEAEKAFERLADLMTKIVELADCPDLLMHHYGVIRGQGSPLSAATLTGAALTEALFRSLPDGFSVSKIPTATYAAASLPLMTRRDGGLSPDLPLDDDNGGGFRPLPLSGALTANLVDPLREAAAEILAGSRPLATAAKIADIEDEVDPVFDWSWLVFVKPATWRDWRGETVTQSDSRALVPMPVFEAAVKAGVAFPENAPEAQAHEERRYQLGFHSSTVSMNKSATVDLDVKWPATTKVAA